MKLTTAPSAMLAQPPAETWEVALILSAPGLLLLGSLLAFWLALQRGEAP